jgi:hypothetical protein
VQTRIQQAINTLRQIDGAHVYLPGEGSVFGLRAGNYIDSAGTLPGVLDSPVGLTLDALGVVGPELVTNGDFSDGATEWRTIDEDETHIITFSGGEVRFQSDTTSPVLRLVQDLLLVTGKKYKVTVQVSNVTSGKIKIDSLDANAFNFGDVVGTSTGYIVANNTSLVITRGTADVDVTLTSISVREISGIHASQNTTADKPKLTRRVNLLVKTEDFGDSAWLQFSGSVKTANVGVAPDGTITASRITFTTDIRGQSYQLTGIAGSLLWGIWVKSNTVTNQTFRLKINEPDLYSPNLTATSSWNFFTHTGPASINGSQSIANSSLGTTADILVWHPSLVQSKYAHLPYQRVNTATDYDTLGFPDRWDFDTTDTLQLTLPAGYESATIIDATSAGPVTLLEQDVTGTYNIGPSLSTHGRIILRDTPTPRQLDLCQGLASRLAGL